MKKHILIIAACLALTACNQAATPHPIITAHVDAFNAKDVAAMAEFEHPDTEWFAVNGGDMTLEISGRDALSEMMKDYLKSNPNVTGKLRDWSINGNFISVTETASWTTKTGDEKSQSALAVYELENGLIRRVSYYPAVVE